MTIDQLRTHHIARPFQPFDLHLVDGRKIAVEHPELLAQSQSGRTIAVACPDDTLETIDLLLVVSIKPRPPGSSKHGRKKS